MSKRVKLPSRTARLEFDGDYEGIWVRVKLNVPLRVLLRLQSMAKSQDADEVQEAFEDFGKRALLEWNLEDDDDQPIPAGAEGMLEVDPGFAMLLIEHWVEAVSQPTDPLGGTSNNGSTSGEASPQTVESSLNLDQLSKLS